jgi:hypothetical protein
VDTARTVGEGRIQDGRTCLELLVGTLRTDRVALGSYIDMVGDSSPGFHPELHHMGQPPRMDFELHKDMMRGPAAFGSD